MISDFVTSYFGALLILVGGLFALRRMLKEDQKYMWESSTSWYLKGWAGAIGLIVVGVSVLVLKLIGKL